MHSVANIYTKDNCVPCKRIKLWLADDAKKDRRRELRGPSLKDRVQFVNIDDSPSDGEWLKEQGIKSVPCLIEYSPESSHQVLESSIGYDEIIERLEELR